ncbi:MAG: primosomal protein N' [Clostridia bacterium]|nr:primosomal protein N' [Clostridia bacterium]
MNAKVRIIHSNSSFDIEYTYIVPESFSPEIHVGVFVDVPFGAGNRKSLGVVVGIDPEGEGIAGEGGKRFRLKEISAVNENYIPLDRTQTELAEMIARRYICGTGEAYGLLARKTVREKNETVSAVKLCVPQETADSYIRARKNVKEGAFALINMLSENLSGMPEKTAMALCGISAGVIKRLADDGIVERFRANASDMELPEAETSAAAEIGTENGNDAAKQGCVKPKKEVVLNEGQSEALEKLSELLFSGKFSEFLLRGVTGSGKTEVYFRLIKRALDGGFGAILLVPEIVLTEQMIRRVKDFFGDNVAVIHSRLTERKKALEYKRIAEGGVRLVLGVRSAVFAPVKNLKLVILDEEQEPSFKSFDARPYYHAGEVAAMRMRQVNGLLVYGSATPRVTTYHRALTGSIGYAFLKERAFAQSLPEVRIVDMKTEMIPGNNTFISSVLANEIKENIKRGEQSILFLPRRGYSSKLVCGGCGKMIVCRKCGVPMTYHKNLNRVVCHYCGTSKPSPDVCPSCGSKTIRGRTFGTEFAEDELSRVFPGVPVVRMDSDTTRAVDGHKKLLDKFENEKVPILIGTQMVAKGLDFPNVTLVGIVNADSLLAIGEYTASERAFQLLTQVTGRAGRDPNKPGRCILQTMNPSSAVIRCAAVQDYDRYAEIELDYRKNLDYPPFASIATITVSGADDRLAYANALALREEAEKTASDLRCASGTDNCPGVSFFPVTRSPVAKVEENYYWCFLAKTADGGYLVDVMNRLKDSAAAEAMKKGSAVPGGKPLKNLKIAIDADIC